MYADGLWNEVANDWTLNIVYRDRGWNFSADKEDFVEAISESIDVLLTEHDNAWDVDDTEVDCFYLPWEFLE